MNILIFVVCFLGLSLTPSMQQDCNPAACVLPNCRCAEDPDSPGKIERADIPQMVIVTFENALNEVTVENYTTLLEGVVNPNQCPVKATFFVEDQDTQYEQVRQLYDDGHEIAIHSLNGQLPNGVDGWNAMIKGVLDKLKAQNIPSESIKGIRAPDLAIGGDEEFIGMGDNGLIYDSSCASFAKSKADTLTWPYTYDSKGHVCDIGQAPLDPFPGKWEFYIADLEWNGVPCASPAACTGVETKRDAFDLFYNSFILHYDGKRSPFIMVINPQWAETENFREGTKEFIEYLRGALSDVWIVTAYQALQWIQDPTPLDSVMEFQPWACS